MKQLLLPIILFVALSTNAQTNKKVEKQKKAIDKLLTEWHKAASYADLEGYFGKMTDDAIYLGTDASEHWSKDEFYKFCKPHFEKGSAWTFKAKNRTIYYSEKSEIAWFDEVLDTWMGDCRGSGVLIYKKKNGWKIKHYNLAVAVPNDIVKEYIKLLDSIPSKNQGKFHLLNF